MSQASSMQDINIEVEYYHTVIEAVIKPVYVDVGFCCCAEPNVDVLRSKMEDRLNNLVLIPDLLTYLQHYSTVHDVIPGCTLRPKFHISFSSDVDGARCDVIMTMLLLVRDHSNDWIEKAFKHWVSGSFGSHFTLDIDGVSVLVQQ